MPTPLFKSADMSKWKVGLFLEHRSNFGGKPFVIPNISYG